MSGGHHAARRRRGLEEAGFRLVIKPSGKRYWKTRSGEYVEEAAMRRAVTLNQLLAADAIVVGAPSYFGSMASPVKRRSPARRPRTAATSRRSTRS